MTEPSDEQVANVTSAWREQPELANAQSVLSLTLSDLLTIC
ncbi:MAG TPA: hypothetical protein VK390_03935 [Propionibacteriaceae bacterium]|nr:hypothetical protein [Propionibacteriaceae bacterium]